MFRIARAQRLRKNRIKYLPYLTLQIMTPIKQRIRRLKFGSSFGRYNLFNILRNPAQAGSLY